MFESACRHGKAFLTAITGSLLVSACGGSSSSPPPPPPPANQAPTADAGPDQTVDEGVSVTVPGSGTDSDGTIASFSWTQDSGTTVTISGADTDSASFTAPDVSADEVLEFTLTVTDDDGATGTDSVQVTVQDVPPSNQAPTADAGLDQVVDEGSAVALSGAGTDPDGTIVSYAWTQNSGPTVTLTDADTQSASFTAPDVTSDEILVFTLTVTDDGGATGTDSTQITVQNFNQLPSADAGSDQPVSSLDVVTLDGSASSDPDGTIEDYTWTQTAGVSVTLDDTNPEMPTFTAPNVGANELLTFELVVTDNDGGVSAADAVDVTINPTLALPFEDTFTDGNADGWAVVDDEDNNGPIETAGIWNVAAQGYVQSADTNTFGGDVIETYRVGTYSYYTDSVNLTDYRFSADLIRLQNTSDDIGVMFRYTDNDNYYRFSINSEAGYSRLESKVNGTFTTLANDFRGALPGQSLFNIVVEVEGPLIQVFVNGDPQFAASSNDHLTGGIGLYSRDSIRFDNVLVTTNDPAPAIAVASPVSYTVIPGGGPRDVDATAIARNVPAGGNVRFLVNSIPGSCNSPTETSPGVFETTCPSVGTGNNLITAQIRNSSNAVVDFDNNSDVAVTAVGFGDKYDAIGDSLTLGIADRYRTDNLPPLVNERMIAFQSWTGPLGEALTQAQLDFNLIGNEGIPGDTSATTRFQRLESILERNPLSNRALVLLGTNDTNAFPSPTTPTQLITNLENIAGRLLNTPAGFRDRDRVYIASLPPVWGDSLNTPYPNPLDPSATRNQLIQDYNDAIQTNAWQSGVELGPDFFSCFLTPTVNRFSLFEDNLHPNGLGYAMMMALWQDVIVNGPPTFPNDPCPAPIYILEDLDPYTHGHKQNLLEPGDEYYNDETVTLTNVPAELVGGIWVTQSNADKADASSNFLEFNVGANPVTVYVAYDPSGVPPDSNLTLAAAALSGGLTVSDPLITGGELAVVSATGVTGTVTIGGTLSGPGATGPLQAYVVIVVP